MIDVENSSSTTKDKDGKKECQECRKNRWNKDGHPGRFQFTKEELDVFNQCSKNSFWYRALPLSLAVMTGTHYAVRSGYLKPNRYVGSLVKVVAFGFVAYAVGKASYIPTCRKKIVALENSEVAEAFKKSPLGPFRVMYDYRGRRSCDVSTQNSPEANVPTTQNELIPETGTVGDYKQ